MQNNTDYVHIEKVPKIDPSQPSLSADCWTVKIQIQTTASSNLILKSMKEHWPVPTTQHYTLLMLMCSWVNVSISSALWIYFNDVLEYITLGF